MAPTFTHVVSLSAPPEGTLRLLENAGMSMFIGVIHGT